MTRSADRALPRLLTAAKGALPILEADLQLVLESGCILNADHTPRRETLDEDEEVWAQRYEVQIAELKAAIALAEAG